MNVPFFDSSRTIIDFNQELEEVLLNSFRNGKYINGPEVKELEEKLASFLGTNFCIACANGSDALTLALRSLEIPSGSEVIVPAFNYVSSAESARNLGLKVKFCDVDKNTFNTSLDFIKEEYTSVTKAVVITHLFGLPISDIQQIATFCKEKNIFLIEDNAQSLGSKLCSKLYNRFAGTFGDISTTSFFPTKNLGCAGDGGAIFTNNHELAKRVKQLASHGQIEKYKFEFCGYNSRLDTLQASLLLIKLNYLDNQIKTRIENASIYVNELKDIDYIQLPNYEFNTFNQFTISTDKRDKLKSFLDKNGVSSMIYYPFPLHKQEAFSESNRVELPNSSLLSKTCLSLPIYPGITREEISYICKLIRKFNK